MQCKDLLFFLILLGSSFVFAKDCLLNQALKDPSLSANGKFWEELGKLSEGAKPTDQQIKTLIEKYTGKAEPLNSSSVSTKTFEKSTALTIENRAEKEMKGLPNNLKAKIDEFLTTALKPGGLQALRENPGRWHFEKLNHGDHTYTVRLNEGYRVLFDYDGSELQIRRVNKGQIHDY